MVLGCKLQIKNINLPETYLSVKFFFMYFKMSFIKSYPSGGFPLLFLCTTNSSNSSSISTFLSCQRSWSVVLGAAVYRMLSFISVDPHIVIFIVRAIVVDVGVDGPYGRK